MVVYAARTLLARGAAASRDAEVDMVRRKASMASAATNPRYPGCGPRPGSEVTIVGGFPFNDPHRCDSVSLHHLRRALIELQRRSPPYPSGSSWNLFVSVFR